MRKFKDFHEAYVSIVKELVNSPEYKPCPRGVETKEILNYHFTVENPVSNIDWDKTGAPDRKEQAEAYTKKEIEWYLSGKTHVSYGFPAKFWETLVDENGDVTSNYGRMVFKEEKYENRRGAQKISGFENVVETLKRDPDSRQAVIHYGESRHFWGGNKDTPCCATNQFFIREGKLIMSVHMRSNDVIRGLTYDFPWFSYLQERVAMALGVQVGEMSYYAGSMHLYKEHYPLADKIIK